MFCHLIPTYYICWKEYNATKLSENILFCNICYTNDNISYYDHYDMNLIKYFTSNNI